MMSSLCLHAAVLSLLSVTLADVTRIEDSCDDVYATAGSSAYLNCTISSGCAINYFAWKNIYVNCTENTNTNNPNRFQCIRQEWNNTSWNISLLIKNVQTSDAQEYGYDVRTVCTSSHETRTVRLIITDSSIGEKRVTSHFPAVYLILPSLIVALSIIAFATKFNKRLHHFADRFLRCGHHKDKETVLYTPGNSVQSFEPV